MSPYLTIIFLLTSLALAQITVNTESTFKNLKPKIAVLDGGSYVLCWIQYSLDGTSSGIYARIFDVDGVPETSVFRVNLGADGAAHEPSISSLSSGGFIVVWDNINSGTGLYQPHGQIFSSDGSTQGSQFAITTATDANLGFFPAVTYQSTGHFVIFYRGEIDDVEVNYEILGQRYNSDGSLSGSEIVVSTLQKYVMEFEWYRAFYPYPATDDSIYLTIALNSGSYFLLKLDETLGFVNDYEKSSDSPV